MRQANAADEKTTTAHYAVGKKRKMDLEKTKVENWPEGLRVINPNFTTFWIFSLRIHLNTF